MLKKNSRIYSELISNLPLTELTALYERSGGYPPIKTAIEQEIDRRLTGGGECLQQMATSQASESALQTAQVC